MLLISPTSFEALRVIVLQELKGKYPNGLHVIGLYPELAKDPEVAEAIRPWLLNPASGFRRMSALALHRAGHADGILHITYNSLRVHPLLQVDYLVGSSWWYDVIRHATALTDECIDLLIQDMTGELPFFHGLTLALVPAEKIVPRMLPLLGQDNVQAFYAAFVLAMHGREEGRGLLEKAAKEATNPFLACLALAKIPDGHALDCLKAYLDKDHPVFQKLNPYFHGDIRILVTVLVYFLENGQDLCCLFVEHYSTPLGSFGVYNGPGKKDNLFNIHVSDTNQEHLDTPILCSYGNMLTAADFLALWGRNDADVINRCLEVQRRALGAFFEILDINRFRNLDSNQTSILSGYFPHPEANFFSICGRHMEQAFINDFHVRLEKDDYIRGATDWIIHGEQYRRGFNPEYTFLPMPSGSFWSWWRKYPYQSKKQ
ncbi:MAG: HEAT repeat domain-containing protein [Gammaproteobacteria bacterium]